MRNVRRFVKIGLLLLFGLISAFILGGYVWISNPTSERLSLPETLISLESPAGKAKGLF